MNTLSIFSFSVLGSSWSNDFLLEDWWLWETESNLMGGQFVVAMDNGIDFVLNNIFVKWVKHNFLGFSSVSSDSHWSSCDGWWENDIIQDFLMDNSEASGSWSHLTGVVLGWWWDDGSVGNNNNGFLVVFLQMVLDEGSNFLESGAWSVWDLDEKIRSGGSVSLGEINNLDTVDEDNSKMLFLVTVVLFKWMELLGNILFNIGWLGSVLLNDLFSSVEHV